MGIEFKGGILYNLDKEVSDMINTTLCYIEKDGKWLMLHRVKKNQ